MLSVTIARKLEMSDYLYARYFKDSFLRVNVSNILSNNPL